MSLRGMAPEEVIEASWFESYERNVEAIWWQLVRLNSSVFVLDKILSFPFALFVPLPQDRHFWNLVEAALSEMCIMIVWRVAVDNFSGEGLTLRQFKKEVLQHFRKEEYREQFRRILRNAGFERNMAALQPKVKELRQHYIAHFNRQRNVNPTPDQIELRTLLFSELKQYCDILNSFFDLLCFGHKRALFPFEYYPDAMHPADVAGCNDIESLLGSVAKDSYITHLPERDPDYWAVFRDGLSEQEFEILNKYRAKFGLPEV